MAIDPVRATVYRPAHMHANLLGFVSMMIFGVAYHVIPRFSGAPLHSRRFAALHLWLANLGLACMAGAWILRPSFVAAGSLMLPVGAALSAAGAFLFITNIWRTLPEDARLTALSSKPAMRANAVSGTSPHGGRK